MKEIHEVLDAFIPLKYNFSHGRECVKWAEDRLLKDEEENDKEIALLAGCTDEEEIKELSLEILKKYIDKQFLDEEYCAGKFIIQLYEGYKSSSVSIQRLDSIISWLYDSFNYPWLSELAPACEYATIGEDHRYSFENEFQYLHDLWKDSPSVEAFKKKYARGIKYVLSET